MTFSDISAKLSHFCLSVKSQASASESPEMSKIQSQLFFKFAHA